MSINQQRIRRILLSMGIVASLIVIFALSQRRAAIAQQVLTASRSTNQSWIVSAEGTNTLRRLKGEAIPILLSWSRGRDPFWHQWVNPVRKLVRMSPLQSTWFWKSEDARRAFAVLRDDAESAVPALVRRLSSRDPDVRRTAVHMLAAIGPSMGSQAFHQMTNCLSDPNQEVRNDLVWAIQFHAPEVYPLETLLAIYKAGLRDSYRVARENAQIGLAHLAEGPVPSRDIIESVQKDSELDVRRVAKQWLKRVGGK